MSIFENFKEKLGVQSKNTNQPITNNQPLVTTSGKYGALDKIQLNNITQIYKDENGKENVVFDKFNMQIKDVNNRGQFIVIVGASGCGKSTLLRYITGLQTPTSGEIILNGKLKTDADRIGMVFQQYSSFTWMTVLENVMLPMKLKGERDKNMMKERAMEIIKLVGLSGHEEKYAQYPVLSGGQLQRVALARNISANNEILLMDEPFSGLDVRTRLNMQDMLNDVFVKMPGDPTIVLVTHDLNEAVYLADEIYIMKANPGTVYKKMEIKLPYKRERSMKRSQEFINYVNELEDTMMSLGQ